MIKLNTKDATVLNSKFAGFDIEAKLAERKAKGTFRNIRTIESRNGTNIVVGGKSYINFSSNDYLGMALNHDISSAWEKGVHLWGAGSGAAPLVTGHTSIHETLCNKISSLINKEKILLFNSGFAANQAIIKTFGTKNSVIYMDKLAHASLQEAAMLSDAKLCRFLHNDPNSLRRYLEKYSKEYPAGLIVTEGVFSMDGDEAPLQEISSLSKEFNVPLMVDDAHGVGVHGEHGLGTIFKQLNSCDDVDIMMGTFGKATGTMGAFVASTTEVIDYMVNFAREYIYSTYMPPAVAYATFFAMNYVTSHDELRTKLQHNVNLFKEGFKNLGFIPSNSTTSIQPILIGDSDKALEASKILAQEGLWVGAIRPPTVPLGTARLRVTITAAHSDDDINKLLAGLKKCQSLLS